MFSKNLKYLRQKKGLEQIELAQILGRKSASTISEWESKKYTPKIGVLSDIAHYFDVELDDLMNIDLENKILNDADSIKKITDIYTQLQPNRQDKVISFAAKELDKQKSENKTTKMIQAVKEPTTAYKSTRKFIPLKTYPFLLDAANAGSGVCDEYQYIEGFKAPVYPEADFIMKVSGDSMSPTFENGDYVYVQKTIELYPGNIGIFLFDNVYYIKEYSDKCLISHNRDFDDIYPSDEDNIHIIGKVLGKVDFDM